LGGNFSNEKFPPKPPFQRLSSYSLKEYLVLYDLLKQKVALVNKGMCAKYHESGTLSVMKTTRKIV
jgi:hypothetical protein